YKVKEVEEDYVARQNSRELSRLKLNKIFDIKVNISQVNFAIVKKWIFVQLNQILPDDDIVMDYLCEMLTQDENPDIKVIHLQMKEFMGEDDSKKFCKKLWLLLNSAQQDPDGIPKEILEETKRKLE
ncbi:PWI domain-containing protein, partial [Hyphopichia burtonii NRRL Y-1933]